MRAFRVTSTSTVEPVTLTDVKAHLRVETTKEDSLIESYITAARQIAENKTRRALVATQHKLTLDSFNDAIRLPRPPLSTVSTDVVINYTKTTGDTTTLSSTVYQIDADSEPGMIYLGYDQDWPTDVQEQPGAISITYRSGYSSSAEACPQAIKNWIMIRVGEMFKLREPLVEGKVITELPRSYIDGLLDPYVIEVI